MKVEKGYVEVGELEQQPVSVEIRVLEPPITEGKGPVLSRRDGEPLVLPGRNLQDLPIGTVVMNTDEDKRLISSRSGKQLIICDGHPLLLPRGTTGELRNAHSDANRLIVVVQRKQGNRQIMVLNQPQVVIPGINRSIEEEMIPQDSIEFIDEDGPKSSVVIPDLSWSNKYLVIRSEAVTGIEQRLIQEFFKASLKRIFDPLNKNLKLVELTGVPKGISNWLKENQVDISVDTLVDLYNEHGESHYLAANYNFGVQTSQQITDTWEKLAEQFSHKHESIDDVTVGAIIHFLSSTTHVYTSKDIQNMIRRRQEPVVKKELPERSGEIKELLKRIEAQTRDSKAYKPKYYYIHPAGSGGGFTVGYDREGGRVYGNPTQKSMVLPPESSEEVMSLLQADVSKVVDLLAMLKGTITTIPDYEWEEKVRADGAVELVSSQLLQLKPEVGMHKQGSNLIFEDLSDWQFSFRGSLSKYSKPRIVEALYGSLPGDRGYGDKYPHLYLVTISIDDTDKIDVFVTEYENQEDQLVEQDYHLVNQYKVDLTSEQPFTLNPVERQSVDHLFADRGVNDVETETDPKSQYFRLLHKAKTLLGEFKPDLYREYGLVESDLLPARQGNNGSISGRLQQIESAGGSLTYDERVPKLEDLIARLEKAQVKFEEMKRIADEKYALLSEIEYVSARSSKISTNDRQALSRLMFQLVNESQVNHFCEIIEIIDSFLSNDSIGKKFSQFIKPAVLSMTVKSDYQSCPICQEDTSSDFSPIYGGTHKCSKQEVLARHFTSGKIVKETRSKNGRQPCISLSVIEDRKGDYVLVLDIDPTVKFDPNQLLYTRVQVE